MTRRNDADARPRSAGNCACSARAHGLISKLPHTHRYLVSDKGRQVITVLIAARQADINKLAQAA